MRLEEIDWLGIVGRKHAVLARLLMDANHPANVDTLAVNKLVAISEAYLIVFFGIVVINSSIDAGYYVVGEIYGQLMLLLLNMVVMVTVGVMIRAAI